MTDVVSGLSGGNQGHSAKSDGVEGTCSELHPSPKAFQLILLSSSLLASLEAVCQ